MNEQQNIDQSTEQVQNTHQTEYPSIYALACPKCSCKNNDFKILGTKGAKGAALGVGMAFGAIGNLVANSMSEDDYTYQPVKYQCVSCGHKFTSLPLVAEPEELLESPCTVNFTRLSCFAGMAVSQNVWLNGIKVGAVRNGKSITFQTFVKHNTVFVTDQYGVAFKGCYRFEAENGGTENISFKKKFK